MNVSKLICLLDGTIPLVYAEETGSTNDDAKCLIADGKVPALIVASQQVGGRGRRGNTFSSPKGGIYMSLVMREPQGINAELLTSFAGVCTCEALEDVHGIKARIKWVNDIYVEGRKLAGILVERRDGHIIVGIGVNGLVTPALDGDVRATSLSEYVVDPDLEKVCAGIAKRIVCGLSAGIDGKRLIEACKERSYLLGRKVSFELDGTTACGVARDLDEDGALLVEVQGWLLRLDSVYSNVRVV